MSADGKLLITGIIAIGIIAWLVTHAGPAAQVITASSQGFGTAVRAIEPPTSAAA